MTAAAAAAPRPHARGRLLESDIARIAATVGVIVIHASAWGPSSPYNDVMLIARFGVPVFAVLTGMLLGYQYRDRALGAAFARRRLSRSLLPWVIWMPVYVVFDVTVRHVMTFAPGDIGGFVAGGAGHLWYLLLVPQLYLIFAVWPRRHSVAILVVAAVVQVALSIIRVDVPLPGGVVSTVVLQYGFLLFPFWVGYFALGVTLGRAWRPISLRLRRALLMVAPVAVALSSWLLIATTFASAPGAQFLQGTGAFLNPLLPLLAVATCALLVAITPRAAPAGVTAVARSLSDLSLGVYIVHPIVLWYFAWHALAALNTGGASAALAFALLVAATAIVAAAATWVLAFTPLAFSVGLRRRPLQGNVAVLALRAWHGLRPRHAQGVDQR